MVGQKEKGIQDTSKPQHPDASQQINDSTFVDQIQLPEVGSSATTATSPTLTALRQETALHKAAARGHRDVVQLLLEKGASTKVMNTSDETPLHLAASLGHNSIVELLLTKGASIEAVTNMENTPLHLAASRGHTSTVELLLMKGASIQAGNLLGYTPLLLTARNGHISTVELLLMKDAALTEVMFSDVIHHAERNSRTEVVKLLWNAKEQRGFD